MKDEGIITEEMIKPAYDYASMFEANKIDRLTIVKAYLAGRKTELNLKGVLNVEGAKPTDFVPAILKETEQQPYLQVAYDEADMAYGVRVTGMGESFVVALHDAKYGQEVTWEEACEFKAPTKKQAALMIAVLDELNEMLESAGGDRLRGWYWTATEYSGSHAWLYLGTNGKSDCNAKLHANTVRSVFA